ncbi:MAG: NlpC/P60 family protein, partial [Curvibacter sp.]
MSTDSGAAGAPADRMSDLVVAAMGAIGVPYRLGGNSYEAGFDCSGFVRAVYGQTMGLALPRQAAHQAAATQVIERE